MRRALLACVVIVGLAAIACSSNATSQVPPPAPAPKPAAEAPDRDERGRRRGGGDRDARRADDDDGGAIPTLGAFEPAEDPCAAPAKSGTFRLEFEHEGKTWPTLVYVPASAGPRDLVVALHGGDALPDKFWLQTRFAEEAEKQGFAVIAPPASEFPGHGRHWNTGKFEGRVDTSVVRDDVAFLDALTKRMRKDLCANRVLVAGFSSGGQMAHRWLCEGREADAGVTAAGALLVAPSGCRNPRPVRGYVGTLDKVFDGPPLEGSDQPSATRTIELWAAINRCDTSKPPTEVQIGDATCREWSGCAASTVLCVVRDFPHGWPAPWNRKKPTQTNATSEGFAWFRDAARAR